jgi:crotonobetaine/carnitine-CoA ligase
MSAEADEASAREPQESVPVLIRRRAETHPSAVLIQDVRGPSITYGEFHAHALRAADALAGLGIGRGDCVVTLNDPRIEAHVCWIGLSWLGAMEVPINPEFRGNPLLYGLNDSRARVVITSNAYLEKIIGVLEQAPHVEHVVTLDREVPAGFPSVRTLASLMAEAPKNDYPPPQLTDPYAVIYTSGTTGPSKGVVTPWGSIQYAALNRLYVGDRPEDYPDPAFYCPWPVFHSSGRTGLVFAAVRGGRFVLRERLSASAFWDDVRRFGCTHTHLLGVASFLFVQPARLDDADNPLKRVLMNPVLAEYREFELRFGVKVSTGWGMTEIGFPTAASDLPNARTCGTLSPLYEARLVDDDGCDVADGDVGQLIIKPKRPWLLLKEYLGKPEATAQAWRDGWFSTGDALRRDADGHFYFVDRVADYLRVRGNNVSSVELEAEVRAHPDVADVAAIGVPAALVAVDHLGARPRAATSEDEIVLMVQPRPGSDLTAQALYVFLAPRLPKYMLPRFIEFVADLPRTPTGKIQKKALRSQALSPAAWDSLAEGLAVAS